MDSFECPSDLWWWRWRRRRWRWWCDDGVNHGLEVRPCGKLAFLKFIISIKLLSPYGTSYNY